MQASSAARLWLSFWPQDKPAVHRLKLTTLKIHPFGLQFEVEHELQAGMPLEIRLLLPPMTAIALKGMVTHCEASEGKYLTSIRFTTIRDTDRKRLADFTDHRRVVRLRAGSLSSTTTTPSTALS